MIWIYAVHGESEEPCGDPDCYRGHDWIYPDEDNIAVHAHCPGMTYWCGEPGCDGVCEDMTCQGEPGARVELARYVEPWWLRLLRWFERLLPRGE